MMKKQSGLLSTISCAVLTLFSINYANADVQNRHSQLSEQSEHYVLSNITAAENADITVSGSNIDSRITIPTCASPFDFVASEQSLKQANITVKVTCPDSQWYLFTTVRVMQTKPVVVITDMLSPGEILTEQNITTADIEINKMRGSTYHDIEKLVGARLKRRVRPGQIVSGNMLCFVCKGDKVIILANTGGLSLRVSGVAQQDGNVGDTISVKNMSSNKLLSAEVASTNEVRVHI